MAEPIKLSFTVEFQVDPDVGVLKVLSRMRIVRSALRKLGFAHVGPLKMNTPPQLPDGLVVALTQTIQ
jgi:hypothetical protein